MKTNFSIKHTKEIAALLILLSCASEKSLTEDKHSTYHHPFPKIVVGGESTGKVSIIKDGRIYKTTQIPGAVFHQVMFSKDGKYVFAAASNQNKVYVFDGEELTLIKEIDVGEHPSHMDTDDSGQVISVTNEDSGDVSFISVSELNEIARIGGFSIPHFARYYNGFWFVANFGAPKISVVNLDKKALETEITSDLLPKCSEEQEECAFFDVSIRKDIGQGLASHSSSGYIIDFDAKNLKVNKVLTNEDKKLSQIYTELKDKEAFKTMLSPFDSIGWTIFKGGVIGYDFVARDISFFWKHEQIFSSQVGIEYPGKFFVLLQDKTNIAVINKNGALEKIIDVQGNPGEGIYHDGHIYVFVLKENATDILAIHGDGSYVKIAELDSPIAEGIHVPGAYPHCH